MVTEQVVATIRKEVAKSKITGDILAVCADRNRARFQVTLRGLDQRMKAAGFKEYALADYVPTLKFMAGLGLGKLKKDSEGKVVALEEIRYTLQSIGRAAWNKDETLEPAVARNRYRKLVHQGARRAKPAKEMVQLVANPTVAPEQRTGLVLSVEFNGKPVTMQIPENLTNSEIGLLLSRFRASKEA